MSALLVGHGLAFAQQVGSNPDPIGREPLPVGDRSDKAPAYGGMDAPAKTFGLRASGEYLLWWTKNGRVPPLVTAGGNGVLGSPGARVLLDSLDFDNDVRQGARFALGYYFAKNPLIGIEANYFFLAERQGNVSFSSDGDPVLAQSFKLHFPVLTRQLDVRRLGLCWTIRNWRSRRHDVASVRMSTISTGHSEAGLFRSECPDGVSGHCAQSG